ncbi:MAG TPA: hypothetical protein VFB88_13200 [Xanthobacteraceae bacterium]|nr:hypothetical protein [Xanthobacteraceae bacterium]
MIAVSIRHRGNDPVIAMSLGAKEHIWNPSHHFTNAELTHRVLPQVLTICGTSPFYCCLSLTSDCDEKKNKGDYFKTARAKASKCRHLARLAAYEACLLRSLLRSVCRCAIPLTLARAFATLERER